MERGSGLLVHISSLPGKYGIGTFGNEAEEFIDFLVSSKQKYWQLLPLNPTSIGDSPYQSFSAFALNPYFIDLDYLLNKKFLSKKDLKSLDENLDESFIDYGRIYNERFDVLFKAYKKAYVKEQDKVNNFYLENISWLEDYALFMTLKKIHKGKEWLKWKKEYRLHNKKALNKVKIEYAEEFLFHVWMQYEAYSEYSKLKRYAKKNNIKIIGDMPIYVALDSSDCWANHKLFLLDEKHNPVKVAGVPPDYFSKTGQYWGNPIYDYDYMKKDNYSWWKSRFVQMSKLYDIVRIDHFRGFVNYWSIPASEETAINGKWELGPGKDFFDALKDELSKIQIIAEDLGILTPDVFELKDELNFPGMKVMQFAFDDYEAHLRHDYSKEYYEKYKDRLNRDYYDDKSYKLAHLLNAYLPHNFETNCVGYIGTHDNDIEQNYINEHPELHRFMFDYFNINRIEDINDTMIGSLMRSCADVVIFMPQDILHLDKSSRINTPGTTFNNWRFRFKKDHFSKELASHLKIMVNEANR